MPTTQITLAAFSTAMAECADAIEARDQETALIKLAKAEAINAGLELDVNQHGDGGALVRRRETLEKTRDMIQKSFATSARASAAGRTRIVFGRTDFSQ